MLLPFIRKFSTSSTVTPTRPRWPLYVLASSLVTVGSIGIVAALASTLFSPDSVATPTAPKTTPKVEDSTSTAATATTIAIDPEDSPKAEDAARQARLLEGARVGARIHQQKAEDLRNYYGKATVLETPPGVSLYAFGGSGDRVQVKCSLTAYGAEALIASSAAPAYVFKVGPISGCSEGLHAAGAAIGSTGEYQLGWWQLEPESLQPVPPAERYMTWALTGSTGEFRAPEAVAPVGGEDVGEIDLREVVQGVKEKATQLGASGG